jgi:hypothetical protein
LKRGTVGLAGRPNKTSSCREQIPHKCSIVASVCVEPEQHEGLGLFGSCSIRDKRAWPIQTLRAGDISFVRPIRTLVHNQMICTLGLEGERKGPTGGQDSAVPAKCQAIGSDQRGPQLIPASRPECETNVLRMICVNWMEPRKCSASRQVSGFSPGLPWKKHAARVDDWLPTCYRTPTQAPLSTEQEHRTAGFAGRSRDDGNSVSIFITAPIVLAGRVACLSRRQAITRS